jgi:cytoskeletal protein RodZ
MTQRSQDPDEDERDRRATNIFLVVFFVIIVGAGLWLVNAMVDQRDIDNCLAQGRRNCAPIEVPAR